MIYEENVYSISRWKNNQISPTELEEIMQSHPAVQESLVFGRPDPTVQEIVSAVVVLNPGFNVGSFDRVH